MRLSRKIMYLGTMQQTSSGLRGIALKSLTGLALGLGIWACSSTDMAGGGPSGTEAGNAIMAKLYNEDGSKATYATVTLIKKTSLSGEANAYTVQADSNGFVVIDSVDVGDYIMEGSLEGNNVQIDVTVANDKDSIQLGEHKLQKPVYISGSLVDYGCKDCNNAFGTLKFFGLNHSTIVSNGMFSIGGLPAGNLNFAFIPNMGAKLDTIVLPTIKAKAGDSIVVEHVAPPPPEPPDTSTTDTTKEDTIVKPEGPLETILIDDFSDGDFIHNMGSSIMNGAWSIFTGDLSNGNGDISIEPKGSTYTASDLIESDNEDNKQIHFRVTFPDPLIKAYPPSYTDTAAFLKSHPSYWGMDSSAWVSQWYVVFGIEIGQQGISYNLSGVDSIVFEAWGKGSCRFDLLDRNSAKNSWGGGFYSDQRSSIIGSMEFELPTNKSRIAVPLADLVPDVEKRKKVSTISWVFLDDAEFYLDNLEFVGYDLKKIWKTK
jgi:hypothetical protein